jgi:hypothetical protein
MIHIGWEGARAGIKEGDWYVSRPAGGAEGDSLGEKKGAGISVSYHEHSIGAATRRYSGSETPRYIRWDSVVCEGLGVVDEAAVDALNTTRDVTRGIVVQEGSICELFSYFIVESNHEYLLLSVSGWGAARCGEIVPCCLELPYLRYPCLLP